MPLQPGDPAPDFTLYDEQFAPWALSAHRGRPVVLLFFPAVFSSTCTTELNTVNNDLAAYDERRAQIVGISTDAPFALAEYKQVYGFQFPLLSDHDAAVSAAFGVKHDHDFTAMKLDRISRRSAFVLDAAGVIRYAEVMTRPGLEPDYEAILSALTALPPS